MELVIAFVLGLLLPSVAVYLVDRRRHGAWVAETASRGREGALIEAAVQKATEVATDTERIVIEHTVAMAAERADSVEVVGRTLADQRHRAEETEAEHEETNEAARQVVEGLQNTLLLARGEIEGLNSAHAEAKEWADKILRDHEWHIAGKEAVHGKEPLIQYGCVHCKAVIYAEEGAL